MNGPHNPLEYLKKWPQALEMYKDILRQPADNVPRFALADWWMEHGNEEEQERGASMHWWLLHPDQWVPGNQPTDLPIHWVCRRGLPDEFHCTQGDFIQHAKSLFETWPFQNVKLTDRDPNYAEDGISGWYGGRVGIECSAPDDIHASIFCWLKQPITPKHHKWREYRDLFVAGCDLSQACVTYGRHLAGLPQLTVSWVEEILK